MTQQIEKKSYNLQLPDQSNICEIIEDQIECYSYICDGFSEQSDSCVDIYNAALWKTAYDFQEWTEEAIDEGLCETNAMGGADLIKIFQMGQYQYYTQMCYDNEKEIYFNIFVNLYNELSSEHLELLKDEEVEEKFEEWADEIDYNDNGDTFKEKVDEWIQELEEELEELNKEDDFEVDEVVEHRMRRAGRWNV